MGGGYGVQNSGVGSNLTIVNLEDTTFPGKLEKRIDIEDMLTNDIVNSTPGSPVVITADTARGIDLEVHLSTSVILKEKLLNLI